MAFMTTTTRAIFCLPRDQKLLEKFVATHDLTEWEQQRSIPHYIVYIKEDTMTLKETDKF